MQCELDRSSNGDDDDHDDDDSDEEGDRCDGSDDYVAAWSFAAMRHGVCIASERMRASGSLTVMRTEISAGGSASWRLQFNGGAMTQTRSRKRSKPSNGYAGGSTANWMAMPSHSQSQNRFAGESASVAPRIRKYWETLSAIERQQILFIDEPDLVKQLYKLNLSLLCVGLMQRHLKTPLRSTSTVKSATAQSAITAAAAGTTTTPASTQSKTIEAATMEKSMTAEAKPQVAVAAPTDTQAEKTYELLEAMEFMDIGTGMQAACILTVKSELVEDPERLFTLVGDVLFGFVSSIHVLSEKQFYDLFVTESEVINTWEDYQRLIAMLVEQLIIKSYVNYLEKEAASQMEQLLLEVSLEDSKPTRKDGSKDPTNNSSSQSQKSKKKKKKKKKDASSNSSHQSENLKYQPEPEDFEEERESQQLNDENNSDASNLNSASVTVEEIGDVEGEEMIVDVVTVDVAEKAAVAASVPPEDVLGSLEKASDLPDSCSKRASSSSSLNPNASVFQPQQEVLQMSGPMTPVSRSPIMGKRKLDKYIVNINIQDAISDDDEYYPSSDGDLDYSSDDDFRGNLMPHGRQNTAQRWREQEDAELQWQLQQIYSSTSTMLGWDFTRQCELAVHPGGISPWDDSALWRTAPKEVVRYFTPGGGGNGFGPFFPPPVGGSYPPPFAAAGPSPQPKSMYYFAPPPASPGMPLTAPFIPPRGGVGPRPRMLPPPPAGAAALPHHQRMFAFQEADFHGVVTSPDFPSMKPELQRDRLLRKDHPDPA